MRLFGTKRKQPKPVIPPELQPYYADRYGTHRRRLGLLLVVLVLILIALGLVWWFGTHSSDKASKNNGSSSKQVSPAAQPPQDNKILKEKAGKPAKTPLSGETTKK